ncbi:CRAL/TRIO domain-containing protein [Mycena floridula]|nr:CRAL/TRIO domain-containing protein [Mycena floridula]
MGDADIPELPVDKPATLESATDADKDKLLVDLTPEQRKAFSTFKRNLTEAGLYKCASEGKRASHDDYTILRFLRARVFDPAAAQKQFAATEAWRKEHKVDDLYASAKAEEMTLTRRFYPRWTGRRSKAGSPIYVYQIGALKPLQKELDALSPDQRFRRMVALYENMIRFTLPLCASLPHGSESPVLATTSIIDLKGVSLSSMWTFRSHLQDAAKLATANYPETLSTIAIVNSPSFFPTVWGWIKGWFDEGTRNKIHVLGGMEDTVAGLSKVIDPKDLPKQYGGELEWTFTDPPKLDDQLKAVLGEFPDGPMIYVDGTVVSLAE